MHGIGTRAVHAGLNPQANLGAVSAPIYQSATFVAEDTEALEEINAGKRRGFVYTRIRNPTVMAAEARITALEEAESTVLFASGMGAVSGALVPFLKAGDDLVATPDIYGGTLTYLQKVLPTQGVNVILARGGTPADVAEVLTPKTTVIYSETPTNPLVRVIDIPALAEVARGAGAKLIVDGTLGGPLNQHLLALGADLVIHSASKYLNGHGDLIIGAVCGGRSLTREIRSFQHVTGATVDPQSAWLLMRGMASFAVRMRQHNASGQAVAEFLEANPKVSRVHYPGLPSHPDHALAKRQMAGFGGLLSFEMGTSSAARMIVDRTRLFGIGPSIGSVESLISQPGNTSHFSVPAEQRHAMGISDSLVRISIGIEDTDDLIADLDQALEAAE